MSTTSSPHSSIAAIVSAQPGDTACRECIEPRWIEPNCFPEIALGPNIVLEPHVGEPTEVPSIRAHRVE